MYAYIRNHRRNRCRIFGRIFLADSVHTFGALSIASGLFGMPYAVALRIGANLFGSVYTVLCNKLFDKAHAYFHSTDLKINALLKRGCSLRYIPNFSTTSCAAGVPATPPTPVSLNDTSILSPTSFIASITWSTGTLLVIPASAMSAAASAFTAPPTLRFTHGTSTRPPTGHIQVPSGSSMPSHRHAPSDPYLRL